MIHRCQLVVTCRVLAPLMLLLLMYVFIIAPAIHTAFEISCMNQMKHVGLCFHVYKGDYAAPTSPPDWGQAVRLYAGSQLQCPQCRGKTADPGYVYVPDGFEEPDLPVMVERIYNHLSAASRPGWLYEVIDGPRTVRVLDADGAVRQISREEALALDARLRREERACYDWAGRQAYPSDRIAGMPRRRISPGWGITYVAFPLLSIAVIGTALFVRKKSRLQEKHASGLDFPSPKQ